MLFEMSFNSKWPKRWWFVSSPSAYVIKLCPFNSSESEVCESFPVLKYLPWWARSVVCIIFSCLETWGSHAKYSREIFSFCLRSPTIIPPSLTHVSLTFSCDASCFQSPAPSFTPGLCTLRTLSWWEKEGLILFTFRCPGAELYLEINTAY